MKFCFFGDVSNALKGNTPGGGEQQIYALARALAIAGHDVVIIDPYAEAPITTAEGVRLLHVPEWNKGVRGLRMFTNRIPALRKMFIEQKADFYYVMMRSYLHLIPFRAARKNKGKFILAVASDVDVMGTAVKYQYEYKANFKVFRFLTESLPADMVFDYLMQHADVVTLQHTGQRYKMTSLRKNQVIFSNIIEMDKLPVSIGIPKQYFIYAGSLTMLKGSDKLLELVEQLDKNINLMIVGAPKCDRSREIYEQLKNRPNVQLMGWREQRETMELISKAKALINTSYFEGFPNIFLEAWGSGVPVISLNVNPGNIFDQYQLGTYCGGDLQKMKRAIEQFNPTEARTDDMLSYVRENHDFDTAAERFVKVITQK